MELLEEEDPDRYATQFAKYIEEELAGDELEEKWGEVHAAIREDPSYTKTEKKVRAPPPPFRRRRRYDDHFSVTCLCPILGPDTFDFPKIQSSGASICDEMSSGSCAGVCKDATTYSYSRVLATISSMAAVCVLGTTAL